MMQISEIQIRTEELINQILEIWEKSVKATHKFLSDEEITGIKNYVPVAVKNVKHLVIAENEKEKPIAFMGIQDSRLEMLFISPDERNKGLGKQLIKYGIQNFDVKEVTVNEQNPQAVGFYEHIGFETYKRTDYDEEGNPYPLLYMKLEKKSEK